MNETYRGQHVLVTGGNGHFGLELVQAFITEGATVTSIDREHSAQLGEAIRTVVADITDAAAIEKLVASWGDEALPRVLVNNAAVFPFVDILDATPDLCRSILEVNVLAPLLLTQLLAKRWIAAGIRGAVINISSASAEVARPNGAIYGPSKAALEQMSRILAVKLAPHGIRVNVVRPGLAQGMNSPALPADHLKTLSAAIPLGRMIQPGELSRAVLFLASDAASFTTGQVLSVDGGGGINRRPDPSKRITEE